jgi:hypothetical protein
VGVYTIEIGYHGFAILQQYVRWICAARVVSSLYDATSAD